jgi:hypothetical protein
MSDILNLMQAAPGGQPLDRALARALRPPALPADFHDRLLRALACAAAAPSTDEAQTRLERERCAQLTALESGYLRLRRRTLATLVGALFAAGAGVAVALPWMRVRFGPNADLILASVGAAIGLAIAAASWIDRPEAWDPLAGL